MDGEKDKLLSSGASAAGDSLGSTNPIQKPRQYQNSYVDDDEEELATPKETDGSEDTFEVPEEEFKSPRNDRSEQKRRIGDRSEQQRRIEEMQRSDSSPFAARVTELEGELTRRQDDLTLSLSKAQDIRAEADALRLAVKGLEGDKANLVVRVGDLESQKEKVVNDMLKKEEEIRMMKEDLKVERGNAIAAAKRADDDVASLKSELKNMEMEREKTRAFETEKEDEIASLKKKLTVAIEKAKEMGFETDSALVAASEKDVEVRFLKEGLNYSSEKLKEVLANVNEEKKVAMSHQEEVILSLKVELEIAKKAASALIEKEGEVASLKQELVLARKKGMEELAVENRKVVASKEVEIVLVKEQHKKAMLDARKREEELEREVKELKGLKEGEAPKISWVTAAAVAASSGTVAAAITAFCLRHNREK